MRKISGTPWAIAIMLLQSVTNSQVGLQLQQKDGIRAELPNENLYYAENMHDIKEAYKRVNGIEPGIAVTSCSEHKIILENNILVDYCIRPDAFEIAGYITIEVADLVNNGKKYFLMRLMEYLACGMHDIKAQNSEFYPIKFWSGSYDSSEISYHFRLNSMVKHRDFECLLNRIVDAEPSSEAMVRGLKTLESWAKLYRHSARKSNSRVLANCLENDAIPRVDCIWNEYNDDYIAMFGSINMLVEEYREFHRQCHVAGRIRVRMNHRGTKKT